MKSEEIKIMGEKVKTKARIRKFTTFIIGDVEMRTDEENNISKRIYVS